MMNDEEKQDEKITVIVQWYKANVVRLVFNGKTIWETNDIALDNIIDPDKAISNMTAHMGLFEATKYCEILFRGLQVGRLEQINLLVQLRVEQWQMKVILFERQLKQRMVDLGLAKMLKDVDPDDPTSYVDDGEYCDEDDNAEDPDGGIDIDAIDFSDTLNMCKDCSGERNSCAGCEDADPDDPDNQVCKGPCNRCPINHVKDCRFFNVLSCDGDCTGITSDGDACKHFGKITCAGPVVRKDYPKSKGGGLASDDEIYGR